MFEPLPSDFDFAAAERRVREFWRAHDVFGRSLAQRAGAPRFVFYEGPPTANGIPHPGHALTRAIKDLFPRYRTMRGELVERKAGWDTHGLPVEVEVCKELGIHTKEQIEAFGVEGFVRRCIDSVFRYTREWEQLTDRIGFWVDMDQAYVTYHQSYVESVWWSLKTLFERGLLYQGHKVVWWWAQGGTALSAGEVGEGYRTVDDPSVYVRFPLSAPFAAPAGAPAASRTSLLVWTTTPWTLVSNHFAAVHPELEYALVHDAAEGDRLVIAAALVEPLAKKLKRELTVLRTFPGTELVGLAYEPPFDTYAARTRLPGLADGAPLRERRAALAAGGEASIGWRVLAASFVTTDSGTGLVHEAPAFGEVDFELLQQERQRFADPMAVPLLCAVRPDGTFSDDAPAPYRGRWIKDCDKDLARELRERGLLVLHEQIRHEYPFSPRAENDPLIQYARMSWFVRTSRFKDAFLANNAAMKWLPDHIQEGRFGDFLRNNVDWALSRERYWGTPLPIWVCERTGRMEAVGAFGELRAKPGATDDGFWAGRKAADPVLPDHLQVHKPYIDAWTYDSPFAEGARMRRVPEVIDVWWDAGSMPFAQWGYPYAPGSREQVERFLPADFISEAIDQTRGWFYALLAINTLLFGPPAAEAAEAGGEAVRRDAYPLPFRTCIVLGHMQGEDGLKMSKRLKNYREPSALMDAYGADALRWYFFSAQVPWTSVRFQEQNIRDSHREFLLRLSNVFSFFIIYANIDGFEPGAHARPVAERAEIDRWIVSELHRTIQAVRESMDRFENYPAARRLNEFVDALSNWYVRRSRPRFWTADKAQDKWDAYQTLHECLLTLSRLLAPFTPFYAETLHQTLTGAGFRGEHTQDRPLSVHLCDYPQADPALIDAPLAELMEQVRDLVSAGRAARTAAKLKVRQPLALAEVIVARADQAERLRTHEALIREELNLKSVEFTTEGDHYVSYTLKPDLKKLGPKLGKRLPKLGAALAALDPADVRRTLAEKGEMPLVVEGEPITITEDEVMVRLEAKPGWSAAPGRMGVVVVATELTPELIEEGRIRELVHHVQAERKTQDLAYEARIRLSLAGPPALLDAVRRWEAFIASECLVESFAYDAPADAKPVEVEGDPVRLHVLALPAPSRT